MIKVGRQPLRQAPGAGIVLHYLAKTVFLDGCIGFSLGWLPDNLYAHSCVFSFSILWKSFLTVLILCFIFFSAFMKSIINIAWESLHSLMRSDWGWVSISLLWCRAFYSLGPQMQLSRHVCVCILTGIFSCRCILLGIWVHGSRLAWSTWVRDGTVSHGSHRKLHQTVTRRIELHTW